MPQPTPHRATFKRVALAAALAIGAGALNACALYPHDAEHPQAQGWRVAHLDREVAADEPVPLVAPSEDCRHDQQAASEHAKQRWALVHFQRVPNLVSRIAPLPSHDAAGSGDEVYVNALHCDLPIESRAPH
jgi:hypothetical protein